MVSNASPPHHFLLSELNQKAVKCVWLLVTNSLWKMSTGSWASGLFGGGIKISPQRRTAADASSGRMFYTIFIMRKVLRYFFQKFRFAASCRMLETPQDAFRQIRSNQKDLKTATATRRSSQYVESVSQKKHLSSI